MDSTIHSDLIRGHIDTIILKALYDGDRYGFDIIKEIEQKSSGQYVLKQPTLYSCLKRLEVQGFIKSYWGARSSGGRRKYYTLTDMGKDLFIRNQNEWVYSRTVIDKLISDKDIDLSAIPRSEETHSAPADKFDSSENEVFTETETLDEESLPEDEEEKIEEDKSVPEEETESIESESVTETSTETEQTSEFVDTTQLMKEIFDRQLRGASYAENLRNEQYVPTESFDPNSYFHDSYDDQPMAKAVPDEDGDHYDTDEIIRRVDDAINNSASSPSVVFEQRETAETQQEHQIENTVAAEDARQPIQKPEFYSYDSTVPDSDENSVFIAREYKNILTALRDCNVIDSAAHPELTIRENVAEEPIDGGFEEQFDEATETEDYGSEPLTAEQMRDRKFKMLESQLRGLGDGVKIRTHNSGTSKQYASTYYFYSNKLMLSHYLILFLIMILEVSITYIAVSLSDVELHPASLAFFILGIIISAMFPLTALIMNIAAPNKTKRITFNYKMSLIFRVIVMLEAFVLIYTFNLILKMPTSFDTAHLVTLLIPALMSTNIPISSMIFQSMYKSKKYSVEE